MRLPEKENNSDYRSFPNLMHLELFFHSKQYFKDVATLLENCPKLQTLSIDKVFSVCENCFCSLLFPSSLLFKFFLYFVYVLQWIERDMFNVWNYPTYVPKCIFDHLKSCTVKFDDTVVDLRIAKYILKNTPLLEDMKITIFNAMVVKYAFQELASCSILSPICKISILGQNSMPWF